MSLDEQLKSMWIIKACRNCNTRKYLMRLALGLIPDLPMFRLPGRGGVLTPGFAFANTSLIDRLNSNQVTFKVEVNDL